MGDVTIPRSTLQRRDMSPQRLKRGIVHGHNAHVRSIAGEGEGFLQPVEGLRAISDLAIITSDFDLSKHLHFSSPQGPSKDSIH
jgi:hypothetical protein